MYKNQLTTLVYPRVPTHMHILIITIYENYNKGAIHNYLQFSIHNFTKCLGLNTHILLRNKQYIHKYEIMYKDDVYSTM